MTRTEILAKAAKLGVPSKYPLRGTKAQIVQQIRNWFQRGLDYTIIADDNAGNIAKMRAERDRAFSVFPDPYK